MSDTEWGLGFTKSKSKELLWGSAEKPRALCGCSRGRSRPERRRGRVLSKSIERSQSSGHDVVVDSGWSPVLEHLPQAESELETRSSIELMTDLYRQGLELIQRNRETAEVLLRGSDQCRSLDLKDEILHMIGDYRGTMQEIHALHVAALEEQIKVLRRALDRAHRMLLENQIDGRKKNT